eukprot:Amastigsp_a846600_46.p6 type:complete len:125 gc:universal Amastigsp_a846600_46:1396-1022(-)
MSWQSLASRALAWRRSSNAVVWLTSSRIFVHACAAWMSRRRFESSSSSPLASAALTDCFFSSRVMVRSQMCTRFSSRHAARCAFARSPRRLVMCAVSLATTVCDELRALLYLSSCAPSPRCSCA